MDQPLDLNEVSQLNVNQQAAASLKSAGNWAKFIAIFSLVLVSIAFIFSLVAMLATPTFGGLPILLWLVYFGVIYTALIWLLMFANKAIAAVNFSSSIDLESSMSYLRRLFIMQGVMIILTVVFFIIAMIVSASMFGSLSNFR